MAQSVDAGTSGAKAISPNRRMLVNACAYELRLAERLGLATDPACVDFETFLETMDRAGIAKSVIVLDDITEEFRAVHRRTGRLYALVHYDSGEPTRGLESLRAVCEGNPDIVRGVATAFPCFGQDPRLKVFGPLYAYCLEQRLPVLIRLTGGRAAVPIRPIACGVLAGLYPELRIVCLDEAGHGAELAPALPKLTHLFLATHGNGTRMDLERLVRAMGSRQLMFATGAGRIDETEIASVGRLPFWYRNNVAWRTATRVFGLPLP